MVSLHPNGGPRFLLNIILTGGIRLERADSDRDLTLNCLLHSS